MEKRERARKLKLPKLNKKTVIIACCILAVAAVAVKMATGKKTEKTSSENNTDIVTRGDVDVVITGSAAIEPNERYEIISMVSGDIVASKYEVGDHVNEGDVLYQFDTSSTDISMEKQRLSMEQSEMSYNSAVKQAEDLTITAPCSGVISGLDIKKGDDIKAGNVIASINNSRVMKVVLPFNESQIGNIYIGSSAEITSSSNMGSMSGKVVDVASVATPQSDGSKLYDVTVEFTNPGAIIDGQTVGGAVGTMVSPGMGTAKYSETGTASAKVEGKVSKVYHSNGDYVERGDAIAVLTSDNLSDSIKNSSISYKNAQLSLKEQEDKLDDYSITSPISGTVITKNSKAGDTIDKTNSTQVLMVVADVSKLKFDLAIDELDVSKISEGQSVEITCDALPNEEFLGVISKVSVEGTASNGVTTYTAEVVVDEPGNLRPSMNVDASVVVEKAENVLRVPTSDIKTAMGRSFVFVKDENAKTDSKDNKDNKDKNSGKSDNKEMPEGAPENMPEGGSMPEGAPDGAAPDANSDKGSKLPQAPDGFKAVEITTGVSGDDFTEVTSGLKEGDIIYSQTVTTSSNNMFGGMGGGMPGGGGGMGGGMPGGGGGMGGGGPR